MAESLEQPYQALHSSRKNQSTILSLSKELLRNETQNCRKELLKLTRPRLRRCLAPMSYDSTKQKLRAVVGLDIRFMVGCDHQWDFRDDDETVSTLRGSSAAACGAASSRQRRTTTPPPLPPRPWIQVTSLSVMCSIHRRGGKVVRHNVHLS